jgi:hypothetical protein
MYNSLNYVTYLLNNSTQLNRDLPRSVQLFSECTTMTRGRFHSPEVQRIVIRLSATMPKEDISVYTGVPIRSVERIIAHFNKHGSVKTIDFRKETEERDRRQLRSIDIRVSNARNQSKVLLISNESISLTSSGEHQTCISTSYRRNLLSTVGKWYPKLPYGDHW